MEETAINYISDKHINKFEEYGASNKLLLVMKRLESYEADYNMSENNYLKYRNIGMKSWIEFNRIRNDIYKDEERQKSKYMQENSEIILFYLVEILEKEFKRCPSQEVKNIIKKSIERVISNKN